MKRGLILLSVIGLALAGAANASVQQGDTELDLLGGFETLNGEANNDVDNIFVEGRLGYFVSDNIQVGVLGAVDWAEEEVAGGDDEVTAYSVGGFANYHFMPTNQWVPYVGGRIAYSFAETEFADGTDDEFDGLEYGPIAGLRFELNAYNDFFAEYRYTLFGGDFNDLYDDSHGIFFGIIHQFK